MSSLGEQTWFRSGDRSLDGWVHRPDDGRVVGALVIAAPFAHEALVTYRTIRVLAVEAARRGYVAVRFSWSGTGDSEPSPTDGDLSRAWQEDLEAAVDLARAASGCEVVAAIGVRFGASVVAAADLPSSKRVLWEPLGGRTFLRMQSTLLKLQLPIEFPLTANQVELCGYSLGADAAASLRSLPDPRSSRAEGVPGHVLIEDDPRRSADLFDRSPQDALVPLSTIRTILDALDPVAEKLTPQWSPQRELVSLDVVSGRRIRQTLVLVGPDNLPGVLTQAVDGRSATTAAVFVPFAHDSKGASRVGRATSFRLAASGIPTLRADRRGIGDAADPQDLGEGPALLDSASDDIALLARWLSEHTGKSVVGIGLCSGAWLVARAAAATPFERVILVNNRGWTTSRRYRDRQLRISERERGAADVYAHTDSLTTSASRSGGGFGRRIKRFLRFRSPYWLRYRIFSPLGVDEVPEMLLRAVPKETSVSVLLGPSGDHQYWQASRGPDSLRRLMRRGHRIEVVYEPRADHSLMTTKGLESYLDFLDREFDLQARPVNAG